MIFFEPESFIEKRLKNLNIRFYKNEITKNVKSFVEKYLTEEEKESFYNLMKSYKQRLEEAKKEDETLSNKNILNDYKQAKNILSDMLIYNKVQEIKKEYEDDYFVWVPSSAKTPRHEHMLLYGKKFSITKGADGKGLLPGQEWGCKCGMLILTKEENKQFKNFNKIPKNIKYF